MWEQITENAIEEMNSEKKSGSNLPADVSSWQLAERSTEKWKSIAAGIVADEFIRIWRMHLFQERLLSHFVNRSNKFTVKILCEFLLIPESPLSAMCVCVALHPDSGSWTHKAQHEREEHIVWVREQRHHASVEWNRNVNNAER